MSDLARILERERRALLDLTTRNPLLDLPRGQPGAATVEITGGSSAELFRLLVRERRTMRFRPRAGAAGEVEADACADDLLGGLDPPEEPEESGAAAPRNGSWLQTELAPERLQSRLLGLHHEGRRWHEERAGSGLHLALGLLEWSEAPGADEPRFAPLILVPVRLERAGVLEPFRIVLAGGEIVANPVLIEKLKREFGLALPDLGAGEPDPAAYFARVEKAIRRERRFKAHRDEIVLGLFSYARLLMYRDLDPGGWPATMALEERPLLRAVLADDFRDQPDGVPDDAPLDDLIGPIEAAHVLDADASQSVAIEEVRRGRNLLIDGPPGTGKSQTVVNLIAQAVRDGRTVLFLAEKRAALEVVKRRLDQIGLGDVALELHSHEASRAALLTELRRTLELGPPKPCEVERVAGELAAIRHRLNRHARALHAPIEPWGVSAYEAIAHLVRLARRGVAQATFTLPALEGWDRQRLLRRRARIEDLADLIARIGLPARHAWRGVGLVTASPVDLLRISALTLRLLRSLAGLRRAVDLLRRQLGRGPMATLPEIVRLLDTCRYLARAPEPIDERALLDPVWQTARATIAEIVRVGEAQRARRDRLADRCTEAAWTAELAACRRDFDAHGRSWFRASRRDWRRARRELAALLKGPPPRSWSESLALLDELLEFREARRWLAGHDEIGNRAFGQLWRGEGSDWQALAAVERWEGEGREPNLLAGAPGLLVRVAERKRGAELAGQLTRLIEAIRGSCRELFGMLELDLTGAFGSADLESVPLDEIEGRLRIWASQIEALRGWMAWRRLARAALDDGLAPLVERLHDGRLKPARVLDAFDIAVYQPLLRRAVRRFPCLGTFDGAAHERLIADFRTLDRERIQIARAEVSLAHRRGLPRTETSDGQPCVLRRELSRRTRHPPIRKLLARGGEAIQAIKPVLMMSPLSVAEFLEPGALRFDLLLIDEASQIEPAHALGAIARAERMVVVGDHRQLPPTSFFGGAVADEAGEEGRPSAFGHESILDLCAARGIPRRMLGWHYRSRHPSLIALPNREFYEGRLQVPPNPFERDPELGLTFRHVPGVYDRGGTGANAIDAQAVARAVMEHAGRRPYLSLGVGCLSVAQRDAILGALERLRRSAPELEPFFDPGRPEPFFVKDVESVQGDERDVVFVSVGYAREPDGGFATTFGSLGAEGGERRLNVLITRARRRLEVFSSIAAGDIDLARAGGPGIAALKTFLQYAQAGSLDEERPSGQAAGSPFEEQVASALAGLGYEMEKPIGTAGCFLDLTIRDPERPGRHLLGIACDGAACCGAPWARDRDRLRQQVLEDRGWILHRVWSIDWYRHPEREFGRLQAAIEEARAVWAARDRAARPVAPEVSVDAREASPSIPCESGIAGEVQALGAIGVAYEEAELVLPGGTEPHLLPLEAMVDAVRRVVQVEGPVHIEEVARRVARASGREHAGRRLMAAVERGLAAAIGRGLLACEGRFYRPADRGEPRVRDRSKARSAILRRPDLVPPSEIRAAAMHVMIHAELEARPADIVTRISRLLGLDTASARVRSAIEAEIDRLSGERRRTGKSQGTPGTRRASAA